MKTRAPGRGKTPDKGETGSRFEAFAAFARSATRYRPALSVDILSSVFTSTMS
jgi:hypothetical protein